MSPKVLLLSTSLGMGGADRQILYLAHALRARQYDVRLISMTPLEEMGRRAVTEGLPITSLEMQRGRAEWRAFQRLVEVLQAWRPDVLTSFMYHANLLGRLAGRWTRHPLIVTSIRSERNGSALRDRFMQLTNWMDDCCTTNSQEVADSLRQRGLLSNKVRVIPNGVDIAALTAPAGERLRTRTALGLSPTDFLWLAVGRLTPQKDYPTLLQAFGGVADPSARLWIAGRGPLLEGLQQQAGGLAISPVVKFLGVRDDVAALLAAADGFVLPSAWEGMPNVVMEALAAGVPVVATRVGGVAELVEADRSGFLVPARDPEALAAAMRKLMALPAEQRREMGARGRDHIAAHYSLEAMAERWIALYRELLSRRGSSAA
jgi:glycosyltransferase involved in cell wall biosynthesis